MYKHIIFLGITLITLVVPVALGVFVNYKWPKERSWGYVKSVYFLVSCYCHATNPQTLVYWHPCLSISRSL